MKTYNLTVHFLNNSTSLGGITQHLDSEVCESNVKGYIYKFTGKVKPEVGQLVVVQPHTVSLAKIVKVELVEEDAQSDYKEISALVVYSETSAQKLWLRNSSRIADKIQARLKHKVAQKALIEEAKKYCSEDEELTALVKELEAYHE